MEKSLILTRIFKLTKRYEQAGMENILDRQLNIEMKGDRFSALAEPLPDVR